MFELSGVELIGYTASALVVLSLTMTSVVRLRMVSLCGSVTFFVYGALIDSVPIMITNGSIAIINVWFLRREFASGGPHGRDLGVSHIRPDSPFLADFVAFHLIDIHRFQPDFHLPEGDDVVTLLLNRDGLPAGLLIVRPRGCCVPSRRDHRAAQCRHDRHPPQVPRARRLPSVGGGFRPLRTHPLNHVCVQLRVGRPTEIRTQT